MIMYTQRTRYKPVSTMRCTSDDYSLFLGILRTRVREPENKREALTFPLARSWVLGTAVASPVRRAYNESVL